MHRRALVQAREGRMHILGKMKDTLQSARTELSAYAAAHDHDQDKAEKIRDVIGKGVR